MTWPSMQGAVDHRIIYCMNQPVDGPPASLPSLDVVWTLIICQNGLLCGSLFENFSCTWLGCLPNIRPVHAQCLYRVVVEAANIMMALAAISACSLLSFDGARASLPAWS